MKPKSRKYEGDFMVPMSELRERARKEYPDVSEERIERLAREKRNFNTKHLRSYLKGHQIFYYGKDEFNRPVPYVVQAG